MLRFETNTIKALEELKPNKQTHTEEELGREKSKREEHQFWTVSNRKRGVSSRDRDPTKLYGKLANFSRKFLA